MHNIIMYCFNRIHIYTNTMYLCIIEIQNRNLSYNFHSGVQIDKALHVETRSFGEQQLSTVGQLIPKRCYAVKPAKSDHLY